VNNIYLGIATCCCQILNIGVSLQKSNIKVTLNPRIAQNKMSRFAGWLEVTRLFFMIKLEKIPLNRSLEKIGGNGR
jgi:hypothetical protein